MPSEKCGCSWPLPASPGRNRGFARLPSAKVSEYPRSPLDEKLKKTQISIARFLSATNRQKPRSSSFNRSFPLPPASAAPNRSSPPPTAPNLPFVFLSRPPFHSAAPSLHPPLPSSFYHSHPLHPPPTAPIRY